MLFGLLAKPQSLLEVSAELEIVDADARILRSQETLRFDSALGDLILVDPSVEFFSGSNGLPQLSKAARVEVLDTQFRDAWGDQIAAAPKLGGEWQLQAHGLFELVVERLIRVQDRTHSLTQQHPFASTWSASSAVVTGLDLFLRPVLADNSFQCQAQLHLPSDSWQTITPWGAAATVVVPHYRDLFENFLLLGTDLEQQSYTVGDTEFVFAVARGELQEQWWQALPQLARRCRESLGPIPQERCLVVLQTLRPESNQRLLTDRGANAKDSLVAYVDPNSVAAFAEHPLGVVAHDR